MSASKGLQELWRVPLTPDLVPRKYKKRSQFLARVMWYVDEVELQWRALRAAFPALAFAEVYWDGSGGDGATFERMARNVAAFVGIALPAGELPNRNHHVPKQLLHTEATEAAGSKHERDDVRALRQAYLAAMPGDVAAALHARSPRGEKKWKFHQTAGATSAALITCEFYN